MLYSARRVLIVSSPGQRNPTTTNTMAMMTTTTNPDNEQCISGYPSVHFDVTIFSTMAKPMPIISRA